MLTAINLTIIDWLCIVSRMRYSILYHYYLCIFYSLLVDVKISISKYYFIYDTLFMINLNIFNSLSTTCFYCLFWFFQSITCAPLKIHMFTKKIKKRGEKASFFFEEKKQWYVQTNISYYQWALLTSIVMIWFSLYISVYTFTFIYKYPLSHCLTIYLFLKYFMIVQNIYSNQ